ncbi:MAG: hypothetical protein LBS73_07335 [Campylobacteraceae bacterium]|jgi:hypothetical protein|nr:hypothetical protein [Campylobacteraceae bacterium]
MAKDKISAKTLEEIGLKEVSRKTYIELSYIKLMAEKNFSKLQRIKTLGFVKIIQRECGVDMSEWVAEFEAYLNSGGKSVDDKVIKTPQSREHKDTGKNKSVFMFISVAFLLFFTVFFYVFIKGRTGNIEHVASPNVSYNESVIVPDDTNEILVIDQSEIEGSVVIPPVEEIKSTSTQPLGSGTKAFLSPHTQLWVGIVELGTFKRKTYLQQEDIDLDTGKEQILISGHGDFAINMENGTSIKFNPRNRIYLHIKDSIVKEISMNDFMTLNQGRLW